MIKQKVSEEELKLYEVLRNPVLFWMLLADYEDEDKPIEERGYPYDYQVDIITDFGHKVAIQASRSGGKTYTLVRKIIWTLVWNLYPKEYIVYTVPNKVHLEPVWNGLTNIFRRHPLLQHFLKGNKGINSSDHKIELKNSSSLLCRIAGTAGNGVNVNGLHTPAVFLDEAGFYPWGTWMELQPTLNNWQNGYQLMVSGVPTGLREKNVLFAVTEVSTQYNVHKFNAFDNPRYTKEQHEEDLKTYGGEESDDYIHFVLGEHGSPSYSLFDRELMKIEDYPVYSMKFSGLLLGDNPQEYITKLAGIPNLPRKAQRCYMGIDLGYTEPTALFILWEDEHSTLRFHVKIQMTKVPYPTQRKIFTYLDDRFDPVFLAIDEGSSGKSVIQDMIMNDNVKSRQYEKRIVPVRFGEFMTLGENNGKPIKQRVKIVAMEYLQRIVNDKRLVFSYTDMDTIVELEKMTYVKKPNGDIVFRVLSSTGVAKVSGDDHFTAALLCFAFAQYTRHNSHLFERRKRIRRYTRLSYL